MECIVGNSPRTLKAEIILEQRLTEIISVRGSRSKTDNSLKL
jgi:hypothetical protein